jgi:hypothetical protein
VLSSIKRTARSSNRPGSAFSPSFNPSSPGYARPRSLTGKYPLKLAWPARDPGAPSHPDQEPAWRRYRSNRRQNSLSLYYFIPSFLTQKDSKILPSVPSTCNHFSTLYLRSCLRSAFDFSQSCLRFTFKPKPPFLLHGLKRRQDLSIEGTIEGTIIKIEGTNPSNLYPPAVLKKYRGTGETRRRKRKK